MKLKELARGRESRLRAADVVRTPEPAATFSVKNFFTAEEWEQIRNTITTHWRKDFSHLQDRYYLAQILDESLDKLPPEEQEELFRVGDDWVKRIAGDSIQNSAILNLSQILSCSAVVAYTFPDKRQQLSIASRLKEFIHQNPWALFLPGRDEKESVPIRVLLTNVRYYLSLFPEDKPWAMEKLHEQNIFERGTQALQATERAGEWDEYQNLGVEMRLFFPETKLTHIPEILGLLSQRKQAHQRMLSQMLFKVWDFRLFAAESAVIGGDGLIHVQDHVPKPTSSVPLPERLVG